jgi:hypothetical protein
MDTPTDFIPIIILFLRAGVRNFEVMLGQPLNHTVYDSVILCSVMSFKLFNLILSNVRKLREVVFSRSSSNCPILYVGILIIFAKCYRVNCILSVD